MERGVGDVGYILFQADKVRQTRRMKLREEGRKTRYKFWFTVFNLVLSSVFVSYTSITL
jgi:hypothetical protein